MTTICFKNGILAADTMVSDNRGRRLGYRDKIARSPDGALSGLVGAADHIMLWNAWVSSDRRSPPPDLLDDDNKASIGILILPDGEIVEKEGAGGFLTYAPLQGCAAWGSGAEIAIGAMLGGSSAKEAVVIAAVADLFTDGEITVLRLSEKGRAV